MQVFVGRTEFEEHFGGCRQLDARGGCAPPQRLQVEQFDGLFELITATFVARDGDAAFAQFGHYFPDCRAGDAEVGREPLARVHLAIREQAHQALGACAHRGRSSQRRRARFSIPSRMRCTFERWVKTMNAAITSPKTTSGMLRGATNEKYKGSAAVPSIVPRPT